MGSMEYGPRPIVCAYDSCQRCFSLAGVIMTLIWNTVACNTSYHNCTADIWHDTVTSNYRTYCCDHIVWMMIHALVNPVSNRTAAVWYAAFFSNHCTYFSDCVAWILVITLVSAYESHIRGF